MTASIATNAFCALYEAKTTCKLTANCVRVRFAMGILHWVSLRIHPSSEDLEWAESSGKEAVELAHVHQETSMFECFGTTEFANASITSMYCKEVKQFLKFVRTLKDVLKAWSDKLENKHLTPSHLMKMHSCKHIFDQLYSCLKLSNLKITIEDIDGAMEEYFVLEQKMIEVLVKRIPDHPELRE